MRYHFIAIGGAVMHSLAIALQKKGHTVTGSDDEIFEPSASKLAEHKLLPLVTGWFPEKISSDLDTVIVGMHAHNDNPELERARELGLRIYSFPEYFYDQTCNKKRIVVGGSHGKSTTTAIIMHVLKQNKIPFDYLVGSGIDGYETMVGIGDDSEIAVIEGDEYLASPIDRRPKFHLYHPDIAVINGIDWDHMNVFPTEEEYINQFRLFTDTIARGGTLAYFEGDAITADLALASRPDIIKKPYKVHGYFRNRTGTYAANHNRTIPVQFFGSHNFQNLSAAYEACSAAGITDDQFYSAIPSFRGATRRMQKLHEDKSRVIIHDFAHAPSKVKATVEAVAEEYEGVPLIAVLELHTYSSLNSSFIHRYGGTMASATEAYIYYNPHVLEIKKLPPLGKEEIAAAFSGSNIRVFDSAEELFESLASAAPAKGVWLFMSSGDFGGMSVKEFAEQLTGKE